MSVITETAAVAAQVVEKVAQAEPMVATVTGMFVPGAAPIVAMVQPWVVLALPYVERALLDVAASNGGDMMAGMIEFLQHITKGQPNSGALSPVEAAQTGTNAA